MTTSVSGAGTVWQKLLATGIRIRCGHLEPSTGRVPHATLFGDQHANADVENVALSRTHITPVRNPARGLSVGDVFCGLGSWLEVPAAARLGLPWHPTELDADRFDGAAEFLTNRAWSDTYCTTSRY